MGNNYDPFNAELSDKKRRKLEKKKLIENERMLNEALDDDKFNYANDNSSVDERSRSFDQEEASMTYNGATVNSKKEDKARTRAERRSKLRTEMETKKTQNQIEKKDGKVARKIKSWIIIILLVAIYFGGEELVDTINGTGSYEFSLSDTSDDNDDAEYEAEKTEERITDANELILNPNQETYTYTKDDFIYDSEDDEYNLSLWSEENLINDGIYKVEYTTDGKGDIFNYYGEFNVDYYVKGNTTTTLNNMELNSNTELTVKSKNDFKIVLTPQSTYVNFDMSKPQLGMYVADVAMEPGNYTANATGNNSGELVIGEPTAVFKTTYSIDPEYPLDIEVNRGDIFYYTNQDIEVQAEN